MSLPHKALKKLNLNPETDHDTKLLRPVYEPHIPRYPTYCCSINPPMNSFPYPLCPMVEQPPDHPARMIHQPIYPTTSFTAKFGRSQVSSSTNFPNTISYYPEYTRPTSIYIYPNYTALPKYGSRSPIMARHSNYRHTKPTYCRSRSSTTWRNPRPTDRSLSKQLAFLSAPSPLAYDLQPISQRATFSSN